jgi:hypothetical protein
MYPQDHSNAQINAKGSTHQMTKGPCPLALYQALNHAMKRVIKCLRLHEKHYRVRFDDNLQTHPQQCTV